MEKLMKDLMFCPACLHNNEVGMVVLDGDKLVCLTCDMVYPLNATLISEDSLRTYIRENNQEHLLKEFGND